jgi:hypothetical protein
MVCVPGSGAADNARAEDRDGRALAGDTMVGMLDDDDYATRRMAAVSLASTLCDLARESKAAKRQLLDSATSLCVERLRRHAEDERAGRARAGRASALRILLCDHGGGIRELPCEQQAQFTCSSSMLALAIIFLGCASAPVRPLLAFCREVSVGVGTRGAALVGGRGRLAAGVRI